MKWNNESGYIKYNQSLQSIKSILGISQIDFMTRCELAPYITYILNYISKKLILLGEFDDIKIYIQKIFNIHDWGADKIINGAVKDMLLELGIDDGEVYIEGKEIPYNQDRFVFSWSNILTALVVRLKFQYSSVLAQPVDTECPCDSCSKGQSINDFENWQSGVYPQDEEYSWYNYNESVSSWRVNNDAPECTKCSRRF